MIFDKFLKSRSQSFLVVSLFAKSAVFAKFEIENGRLEVSNSTFNRFEEGESLTQALRGYLDKIQARNLNVVFGLPSFWIEKELVKPEYESRLLQAVEELKLTPTAFVSTTAAVGFYKFRQNPNFSNFYILEVFDKKILAEKFENGEMVKTILEEFDGLESVNFSNIFGYDVPSTIFVFVNGYLFEKLSAGIKQFFENENKTLPEILELEVEDFANSLATATAFDLGKLPVAEPPIEEKFSQEERLQKIDVERQKDLSEFGFVEGADIKQVSEIQKTKPEKRLSKLLFLPNFFKQFLPNLTKLPGPRKVLTAGGFFAILTGAIAVFWFLPHAAVELDVKSSPYSSDLEVRAVPTASAVDGDSKIIPAKVLATNKEGNKKTVTSGKKKVGERAQGTVTVFNKTASSKTFSSGTIIVRSSNQKFIFKEAVTVASRSATLEGIIFGKSEVVVEATEIGEAGNLPAETNLTFADFDSSLYSAHSKEDFTGGTSKEISIVTVEDRKRLEDELVRELTESAKKELIQLAADKRIEDDAILAKPEKLQFDKEVDTEANILQLTARISFTATIFSAADLERLITDRLKNEIPADFGNWQNQKIETQVAKVENDGTLRLKVKFEADLIPILNNDEILENISGKSVEAAKNYLLNVKNVENVIIELQPKLPGFLGTLPRIKSRIKLEVKAQTS